MISSADVVIIGGGIVGSSIAYQLTKAGCRNVVASLWKVDDEATAALMVLFYRQLWGKEKVSRMEALRRAQLAIYREPGRIKEWSKGRGPDRTGPLRHALKTSLMRPENRARCPQERPVRPPITVSRHRARGFRWGLGTRPSGRIRLLCQQAAHHGGRRHRHRRRPGPQGADRLRAKPGTGAGHGMA